MTEQLTGGIAKAADVVVRPLINALVVALPIVIKTVRDIRLKFEQLPQNLMLFIYGCIFCFFGGTFPTLFAAIQAAEYGGRKTVMNAIVELADEALVILEEVKKDDDVDADKDGKKDVEQISGSELLKRKTLLVLKKMNPEKIDKAISSIYKVWLSVAAVLAVQFARTISMALAIAEFLQKPCDRFITPVLKKVTPDDYDKWVPVILSWITKSIAMSIAWYIQSVISGATSALKGGLMMARAAYQFCVYRNMDLFGLIPPDDSKSAVDEVLSYIFASLGFYVQFRSGFTLPSPLNLLLWPLELGEYYIRWTITNKTA